MGHPMLTRHHPRWPFHIWKASRPLRLEGEGCIVGETNHWETRLDSTMLARYPKNMSVNQLASVFYFVELQHGDKNCEIIEAAAGFVLFLLDILPVNIVSQRCLACFWHFREGDTRPFFLMPFVFNRWYVWNPSSYFPCRRFPWSFHLHWLRVSQRWSYVGIMRKRLLFSNKNYSPVRADQELCRFGHWVIQPC